MKGAYHRVVSERRHETDGAFPSSPFQSGMRAGDDDRGDDGATARGRALGMEPSPPLAPSQGCEQETTNGDDDGATARGRVLGMEFSPPPLAPSQGCEQGTTMAVPQGTSGTNKLGAF